MPEAATPILRVTSADERLPPSLAKGHCSVAEPGAALASGRDVGFLRVHRLSTWGGQVSGVVMRYDPRSSSCTWERSAHEAANHRRYDRG
jgi:hypothetical protein